ncbi:hypothetical protein FIU83_06215 [Halomonas sp. THAF5a]|uniref:hypothetical protein n=1 Tax=Halomonas sp. THAF5a TaxID=2587844 RepID=UPI0012690629|nr:hypothetical protein [Halomonas sp. THAF5a]QFU01229.1 hypothetical protein FIU83_06215 [Halomonas sp. THAF5a]
MTGRSVFFRPLRRHGHLALAALVLLGWSLSGEGVAGMLFVPIWVLATQLIVAGSLEASRLRRRAWLGQYLRDDSPWRRWLAGGVLMVLRHQFVGALLALVLLVDLRLLALAEWPLLLAALPVMVLARHRLRRRLSRHVVAEHLPAVTRRLLVMPISALLALAMVLAALWLPQPWLVGLVWEEAITRHLVVGEGGGLLGVFERLAESAELTRQWAMQNAVERFALATPLAVLGWLVLLLTQGAVAWAYVRLLVGAEALRREGRSLRRKPSGEPAPTADRETRP